MSVVLIMVVTQVYDMSKQIKLYSSNMCILLYLNKIVPKIRGIGESSLLAKATGSSKVCFQSYGELDNLIISL